MVKAAPNVFSPGKVRAVLHVDIAQDKLFIGYRHPHEPPKGTSIFFDLSKDGEAIGSAGGFTLDFFPFAQEGLPPEVE